MCPFLRPFKQKKHLRKYRKCRCTKCKSDHRLGTKVCRKCGISLANNKKYKVADKGIDGKRTVRLVDTHTLAKRVESSPKGKIAENKILNVHKAPFIDEIWDKYAAWAVQNKKDWRHDFGRWKWHVAPHVIDKRMDQLYPHDVETVIDGMKKIKTGFKTKDGEAYETVPEIHAPATKKQVLVLIKRVYNWAIKRELYFGQNPATKIKAPKINNQVTDCLTKVELDRLLAALDIWANERGAMIVRFPFSSSFRITLGSRSQTAALEVLRYHLL